MPARERTQALAQMPGSMQSAVWTRHLLATLVEHPELTVQQRSVIQEALSLLTPELFEIDASSPRWEEAVDRPLRRLKERAVAAFPDKAFARDLFTRLGPDVPAGPRQPRVITNSTDCICNPNSDWCGSGQECDYAWCVRTESRGCGTMLLYPCLGMCFLKGWP